ncbi:MAG: tetratricopeptide repeat protein [Betaproteobacteria bacterium]|nr:tetratricopeptide repeat protein [Betaproteobacteria bacterium]
MFSMLLRLCFLMAFAAVATGFHPASAAHAALGTLVGNAEMATLAGGKDQALKKVEANVLVFFRPNQERSLGALRELAQCQSGFTGKSVHWVAIVSNSAPTESIAALLRDTGFNAPVLLDRDDALYGSLGLALHPVVVIVGSDQKLVAFEPFRSVDFCTVVAARIRHLLREISDEELNQALTPAKSIQGGSDQVAKRYRAFAEALFKDKNYDKALENVRKSLDKAPLLAPAHALLGEILAAQGNCAEAIPAFNQALTLDAANTPAKEGLERCKPVK